MKLSEIAAVSGKSGLFKVLKPAKAGLILESMDENKTRVMASGSHKVSLLNEIAIYTHTKEGTISLEDVLKKIHKDFGDDIGLNANAEAIELKAFLKSVLPDYDENKVYVSDIKKLVKWYSVLLQHAPEIFEGKKEKSTKKIKKED